MKAVLNRTPFAFNQTCIDYEIGLVLTNFDKKIITLCHKIMVYRQTLLFLVVNKPEYSYKTLVFSSFLHLIDTRTCFLLLDIFFFLIGPVFVELPLDVLYPINEIRANMGLAIRKRKKEITESDLPHVLLPEEARKAGLSAMDFVRNKSDDAPVFLDPKAGSSSNASWVTQQYLKWRVRWLFASAWRDLETTPLPIVIPLHSIGQLNQIKDMLR